MLSNPMVVNTQNVHMSNHHIIDGEVKVTQLCLTLCHSKDCGPPGSSVLGILQARILEWVAMPVSIHGEDMQCNILVTP